MAFLRRLNRSSHSAPVLQQQTELTQMEEIQHAQSAISDEAVPDHVKTVPLDAYAQLQLDMLRTASLVPGLPPVASRLNAWNPEERMNARSARNAERILSRADETLVKLRAAAQQPEKSWTDAVSEEALRLVHARHSGRE